MILYCSMISFLSLSLTLGYLSKFNKEHINGWSSGTGMAGIVGAVLFLALCEYEKREGEREREQQKGKRQNHFFFFVACIAEATIVGRTSMAVDPDSDTYTDELKKIDK